MAAHGLNLALEKTEVVILTKKRIPTLRPIFASWRRLLMSSTQSVVFYGAEVWVVALDKEVYRKGLAQVQRRGALRVVSAYRTVSEPTVMVFAGVIPVVLLAEECQPIYKRKGE